MKEEWNNLKILIAFSFFCMILFLLLTAIFQNILFFILFTTSVSVLIYTGIKNFKPQGGKIMNIQISKKTKIQEALELKSAVKTMEEELIEKKEKMNIIKEIAKEEIEWILS